MMYAIFFQSELRAPQNPPFVSTAGGISFLVSTVTKHLGVYYNKPLVHV